MLRAWWQKISRVDAGSPQGMLVFLVMVMSAVTVLSLFTGGIHIAIVFWVVFLLVALMRATVIEKAAAVLIPKGTSTPSVAQHSNIQAMVAQGHYAQAAAAYRDAIAADPLDLVACEQLGQLALRELKDYPTALFAYREAEKRTTEPRRRVGYALIAAGIYRDNLQDVGKAIVELRRILATYPDTPNAAALRAEIDELRARHFEGG
jgi:tetratricopeptide (TPR) repeat protein